MRGAEGGGDVAVSGESVLGALGVEREEMGETGAACCGDGVLD